MPRTRPARQIPPRCRRRHAPRWGGGGKGAGTVCRDAAAGGCEVHFRRQDLRSETDESRIHSQIGRFVWEQSGQSLIEWMLSIGYYYGCRRLVG
eukprot:COSAG01_NODE_7186_length_3309_cov_30.878656_1_plen_94_part_00